MGDPSTVVPMVAALLFAPLGLLYVAAWASDLIRSLR